MGENSITPNEKIEVKQVNAWDESLKQIFIEAEEEWEIDSISNPQCEYLLMSEEGHNEHYSYFLTDEAIAYQGSNPAGIINKELYMEHDSDTMELIIRFFEKAK